MSVSSANPATPYTRAEFFNACTSVLESLNCLQKQHAVIDERSWEVLNRLGQMISDLRPEVKQNKEYWVDGPLVRFLTANVLKAKSVLQEMKRTCSQQSAATNGMEYVERHIKQHVTDIKTALEELEPYHQNTLYERNTRGVDEGIQYRMGDMRQGPTEMVSSGILKKSPAPFDMSPKGREVFDTTADVGAGMTQSSLQSSQGVSSGYTSTEHDPMSSKPGVFEHIQDVSNIYPQHSPSWPKYEEKPNLPFERTQPPLVHPGLRDMHNYKNLPQFTGVNLPMPRIPDGEVGHRAPHVPHWDSTNHYAY